MPTDATDFSSHLLKIRNAKPDLVVLNLSNQITNFLKQYSEFGLYLPVGGFGFDTALAWRRAGQFCRHMASSQHHLLETPGSKTLVAAAFTKKYGKPPENQAWGDYIATKIVTDAMRETKSTDSVARRAFREGRQF